MVALWWGCTLSGSCPLVAYTVTIEDKVVRWFSRVSTQRRFNYRPHPRREVLGNDMNNQMAIFVREMTGLYDAGKADFRRVQPSHGGASEEIVRKSKAHAASRGG